MGERRFTPSHIELKNRVDAGQLGKIVHCIAEATVPGSLFAPPDGWRNDPVEMVGGAMAPLGIHALDGLIDLLGRINSVYCLNTNRAGQRIEDTTTIVFQLSSGVSASIVSSMVTARNYRTMLYGTRGSLEAVRTSSESLRFVPVANPKQPELVPKPEFVEFPAVDAERASLEAFARAVRNGIKFPVPADELVHVAASFEAAVQSAKANMPVIVRS